MGSHLDSEPQSTNRVYIGIHRQNLGAFVSETGNIVLRDYIRMNR